MKKCPHCNRGRAVVLLWRHRDTGKVLTDGQFSDTVKVAEAGEWDAHGYYCSGCAKELVEIVLPGLPDAKPLLS